ncbi:Xylose isomerase domain protein TIM barrel [Paenibacillus curdlanolyticus YK9]|uniref:Xylose isomerase domain protein TIM barrel n=1 Tax=Paenibacillus curdlanolyticus YK9 TaxID=717606 RepID=E0ID92_9BACL|nr:sugar phosphate isomerase/epimerase [Paenibacillus curdlanolyticus]EFM09547.1 Xylose isomerase domain protein TIM barrel [Paenibacillus curdlanolyticus YK9]
MAVKPIIGIQMYTLRDRAENDFIGTIREVAELGYQAIEFAGFFNTSSSDVKKVLEETGLKAPSAHIGLQWTESEDEMWKAFDEQIAFAKEIGLQYIVTPWAPLPENPNQEDVDKLAGILKQASTKVKAAGMTYGYHNHDFELKLVDGVPLIDRLLQQLTPDELIAEFDLGWVHIGGGAPADYISRYAGRVPLAHFKDFGDHRSDTEIGAGLVNFQPVLAIAEQSGIEYFIVEQEQFQSSSLESAKISLEYFRKKGYL